MYRDPRSELRSKIDNVNRNLYDISDSIETGIQSALSVSKLSDEFLIDELKQSEGLIDDPGVHYSLKAANSCTKLIDDFCKDITYLIDEIKNENRSLKEVIHHNLERIENLGNYK
ncbi:MAG: hypothetical protein KDE55_02760 [Novosphingobium sp.]|nr:hypothetical protein [Novosphingobium sp.]